MSEMNYVLGPNGNFISEDELYHYGVLGMKWGVHRAVRKDPDVASARKQYAKDFNAAYNAGRRTKSFAVTKRGKAKKERLDKDYSDKYDQMIKSAHKLNKAESKARKRAEAAMKNQNEFSKERQRQKDYLAKKRVIQTVSTMAKESSNSDSVKRLASIGSMAAIGVLDRNYARDTFR